MAQKTSVDAGSVEDTTLSAPRRSLWRNRDFMLLWSGQLVSSVGTRVTMLAFPLLVLAVTHSPAQAGLIAAVRSVPYLLVMLPAGALVDHWNRKRVMIVCDIGRALVLGSIPLALALGNLTLLQLYLVSLVEGTLFSIFNIAETACLPEVVEKAQLTDAVAQNTIIDSASGMAGPTLGGILYSIGSAIPFLSDAITYVISFLSLFFVRTRFRQEREARPIRLWHDIREGLAWLWSHPLLRFIALLNGGLYAPVIGYSLILIVLAQGQHASPVVIGLIFAGGGVGSIIGAFLVGPLKRRFTFNQLMVWGVWAWSLTWLLLAIAPNPLVLGIATALSFIVVPIYTSVHFGFRLETIPDHLQGRVNSVFRLLTFGSEPIGMAVTGFLLQAIGPIPTILVLFIPQGVLSVVTTFSRHFRG
ncbi:MAG TPA: MFS transporter [Ktedonobacteraceae bacterium]|jgi:MFS family permease|nr:MFS transporter [Ktedonobacteraceae bacterium]